MRAQIPIRGRALCTTESPGVCMNICIGTCAGICIGMRMGMCTGMCTGTHGDKHISICLGMCKLTPTHRHPAPPLLEFRPGAFHIIPRCWVTAPQIDTLLLMWSANNSFIRMAARGHHKGRTPARTNQHKPDHLSMPLCPSTAVVARSARLPSVRLARNTPPPAALEAP